MALNITTHYKQPLTSKMLNHKVSTLAGGNIILEGFEVSKNNNTISIAPGKCIIQGAIIESDEAVTIQAATGGDLFVGIEYIHESKKVNFFAVSAGEEIGANKLLLAQISGNVTCEEKMRSIMDLSSSLKSIKENMLDEQELEYEGESIVGKDSVAGATSELKIKGQTIVNVAPIKEEIEVYADLQSTESGNIKFLNTADGVIDGINIRGKSYQNVIQKDAFKSKSNFTWSNVELSDGLITVVANGNFRNAYLKFDKAKLKLDTNYTIIFEILSTTINGRFFVHSNSADYAPSAFKGNQVYLKGEDLRAGIYKYSLTTKSSFDGVVTALRVFVDADATEGSITFRYAIVEGDHVSNPDLNNYFEGIIGVGDNSESGYKIDILSCGQNLADISTSGNTNFEIGHIKKGQSYSLKFVKDRKDIKYNLKYKENNIFSSIDGCGGKSAEFITFTSDRDAILYYNAHDTDNISEIMLVEGICTSDNMPPFKPYECDDEQILLQEPLHSLSSDIYDEIVGDKIIRRVGKIVLNGSEDWINYEVQTVEDTLLFQTYSILISAGLGKYCMCDEFIATKPREPLWGEGINYEGIKVGRSDLRGVDIRINKSRLATEDVDGLKQWLKNNPLTFYYQLSEPIITPVNGNCILPNGVCDRVVGDEIERNIGKISFDGSETWSLHSENEENIAFSLSLPDVKTDASSICNTLPHSSAVNPPAPCFNILGKLYIRVLKTDLTSNTVEGFKEWLTQNPTTIWYELNTPYYEPTSKPRLKCFTPETNITGSTFIPTPFNIQSYGYRKEALIKPNTQYTIHFNNKYADANSKNIKIDLGGAVQNVTANNSWLMLAITTPATLKHNELRISGYGIKVSNVMCNEGSEYREFVDGLASVGNKSKNLFNPNNSAFVEKQGDKYVATVSNASLNYDTLSLKPNTKYTVSAKFEKWLQLNIDGVVIASGSAINGVKWTFTTNNTSVTKFYFGANSPSDIGYSFIEPIQLEEGSPATPYEPYHDGHKIEILSNGKNLFKPDIVADTKNYTLHTNNGYWGTVFKVKPNTNYRITSKSDGFNLATIANSYVYFTGNGGGGDCWIVHQTSNPSGDSEGIVNSGSKGEIYIRMPDYTFPIIPYMLIHRKIQIEEGTTGTTYTPYTEDKTQILLQEPLRSLPNGVCDTIEQVDGNYVVVRRCGEVLLDGSERWRLGDESSGWNRDSDNLPYYTYDKFDDKKPSGYSVTDRFLTSAGSGIIGSKKEEFSLGHSNYCAIRIHKSKLKSDTDPAFKDWMSKNPITVIYELNTPVIHPLDAIKLPNNIVDTVTDKQRVRMVGKVKLVGDEGWSLNNTITGASNNLAFTCDCSDWNILFRPNVTNLFSYNIPCKGGREHVDENEGICLVNDRQICLRISKDKLKTPDLDGLNQWLSQNPTTVWYELETPIEEDYISPNLNLDTYEETTHITSNASVPAIINAKIPSTIGSVIKNDIERLERIENWIDKVILPSLVESHYQKTLLEFDYSVSRMVK